MNDGPAIAAALRACGVTHVVWVPDSDIGQWDTALSSTPGLQLIRVCREGEAIAVAAGLLLGGKQPLVFMQCTGLFEAGDALRNIVHDLKLPLFLLVGVRSWSAHQQGKSSDNCPVFTEPILQAWKIPFSFLDRAHLADQIAAAYQQARRERRAAAVLLPE